jgi:hypothetical protein
MALHTSPLRLDGGPDRRRLRHVALIALGIGLPLALDGCVIDAWRSLNGVDKNDPNPQTAPFSGNMAAAEAEPYPNLASFPPLPTRTTNAAERQKLTQSLIADRSALAADSGLAPARPDAKAAPAALAATAVSAAPLGLQPGNPAGPSPAAAPPGKTAFNSPQSGRRAMGEPPEPGPRDSSLQMPDVRSVPEPETTQPPPPAPALPAAPAPAPAAQLPPAAVASAMPQPAPPEPVLAPVAPPPAAAKPEPRRVPAGTTVATLDIRAAVAPGARDREQIDRVAALYRDNPGTVRVLAYAAASAAGGDPLDSYHAALERAQTVAKALADAGIPEGKIQTQAAPAAGARPAGRVEIQFTQ